MSLFVLQNLVTEFGSTYHQMTVTCYANMVSIQKLKLQSRKSLSQLDDFNQNFTIGNLVSCERQDIGVRSGQVDAELTPINNSVRELTK